MLLTCAFAASGAFASEPDGQVRTEGIKYEDLNLSTTAGVGVLYQRIHSAAQRVCAGPDSPNWVLRLPRRSAARTRRLRLSKR
jgi:UrcA family protein